MKPTRQQGGGGGRMAGVGGVRGWAVVVVERTQPTVFLKRAAQTLGWRATEWAPARSVTARRQCASRWGWQDSRGGPREREVTSSPFFQCYLSIFSFIHSLGKKPKNKTKLSITQININIIGLN